MLEVKTKLEENLDNDVNAPKNRELLTRLEEVETKFLSRNDGESSSQQTPESAPTTQSLSDRVIMDPTIPIEKRLGSFLAINGSNSTAPEGKSNNGDTKTIDRINSLLVKNGNDVEKQGPESHQHSRKVEAGQTPPPQVDFDAKSPVFAQQSLLDAGRAFPSEAVRDSGQEVKSLRRDLFPDDSNNAVTKVGSNLPDLTSRESENAKGGTVPLENALPADRESLIKTVEGSIEKLREDIQNDVNKSENQKLLTASQGVLKKLNNIQERNNAKETQDPSQQTSKSATPPLPLPQIIRENPSPSASSSIGLEPSTQDESTQSTHALRAINIATTLPTTEALPQSALEIIEERNSAPPMPGAGSEHQQTTPPSEQKAPKSANDIKEQPLAVSSSVSNSLVLESQQNLFAGTSISQESTDSSTQGLQGPQLASDKVGGQEVPGPASSDVPEQPGEKNDPKSQIRVPSATPPQPQDPKNNSSCYPYLSSFYKNFVASLESFKEGLKTTFAFGKKTDETKDTNTPNSTMRARIWEALVGMIPNRFKPTSNAESSIEDPLLPKEKEGIGRS